MRDVTSVRQCLKLANAVHATVVNKPEESSKVSDGILCDWCGFY